MKGCKRCGSIYVDEVIMPQNHVHYSKIICRDCGGFLQWGKRPSKKEEKIKNYTGGKGDMNKVQLMGRLTKDPELRYTSNSNTAVASFSLAVNRMYTKDDQPDADFIRIIAFGKLAETISKYLEKGRRIVIVGKIQTRTWDDDGGTRHYVTEVIADEMHFADDKKAQNTTNQQGQQGQQPKAQQSNQQNQQPNMAAPPPWLA